MNNSETMNNDPVGYRPFSQSSWDYPLLSFSEKQLDIRSDGIKSRVLISNFEKTGSLHLFNSIKMMQEENNTYRPYKRSVGLESVIQQFCGEYLHHPNLPQVDVLLYDENDFRLSFPHPDLPDVRIDIDLLDHMSSLVHCHLDPLFLSESTPFFRTRKVVYMYRDIRDVIHSWIHYAVQPATLKLNKQYRLEHIDALLSRKNIISGKMQKWSEHVRAVKYLWDRAFIICFERFVRNRKEVMAELSAYLELPCDPDRIASDTEKIGTTPAGYTEYTETGGWRELFDEEMIILCKMHCGQTLIDLGYEKDLNW